MTSLNVDVHVTVLTFTVVAGRIGLAYVYIIALRLLPACMLEYIVGTFVNIHAVRASSTRRLHSLRLRITIRA